MKTALRSLSIVFAISLCQCTPVAPRSASAQLPPGTIQLGSLANQKLIFDAGVGAAAYLATKGQRITPRTPYTPYVVAHPSGRVGSRRWAECWIYRIGGKDYPVTFDFTETGLGGAGWSIRK